MKLDYRHAWRPILAVGALLAVAALVRCLLQPATFGQFGHYRGAAVAAARARTPLHRGQAVCARCHAKQVALHDKDAHTRVQCETCHGVGELHVRHHEAHGAGKAGAAAASVPPAARMARPDGKRACLVCHEELAGRPGPFPQVEWRKHYAFVGVKDEATPCVRCHDPHEPLFMDRDLRGARLHPVVHRCRDCHTGSARDESMQRPAGHPATFDCAHCHREVAADFATKSHRKVRCTTCHLFFAESPFAGRIIRDADPRFCLLCHRGGDFRSNSAPPSIEWPAHREEMAEAPEDASKRCARAPPG